MRSSFKDAYLSSESLFMHSDMLTVRLDLRLDPCGSCCKNVVAIGGAGSERQLQWMKFSTAWRLVRARRGESE